MPGSRVRPGREGDIQLLSVFRGDNVGQEKAECPTFPLGGKTLYLADDAGRVIYKYDVLGPGKLAGQTKWIDLGAGPDGMTLDEHGNLYVACGRAGIKVYSPQGQSIGVIQVPYASNCVFGGPDFKTLYVTSADKFLAIPMKVRGIKPPCTKR